jgi:xylulokinase
MMCAVLLDEQHEPVRPALIWADRRSAAQARQLADKVGADRAYALLGHRLNPTYSLTKVMWVRDHEPEVFARVRHFCLAKDFVNLRMTGRLATDRSDASGTNAFDQQAGTWSGELLDAAGLDPDLFPEILPSTEVLGGLTRAAAEELGLAAGTPVVVGGGDGPLAAVGAGVVAPEDGAYVYLGSSSWVSLAATTPLLDPAQRTMTFDNVVPGGFVPTATMQAGGASLSWVCDLLSPQDPDRFADLLARAGEVEAAREGVFFLPHLLGERSPYWNPDASGAFVGLGMHHDRGHLVRAVVEGVAFNLLTCIDAFREAGQSVDHVAAIGGGAASEVWLQILADTWGCRVSRRSVVEEANSLGAAVTAAVGLGLVDDFGIARDLSVVTAVLEPDQDRHTMYREQHATFVDAYERLEGWFPTRGADS